MVNPVSYSFLASLNPHDAMSPPLCNKTPHQPEVNPQPQFLLPIKDGPKQAIIPSCLLRNLQNLKLSEASRTKREQTYFPNENT